MKKIKAKALVTLFAIGIAAIFLSKQFFTSRSLPLQDLNKIQISVSFYPLYFFTSEIAGDKAVVYNLTPAGAEPHDYELTSQDIARIEESRLLLLNGGKLEAWGNKVKDNLKGENITIVTIGDKLINKTFMEDGKVVTDPHIWLDPALAIREVEMITEELGQADSANADYYRQNAEILKSKLAVLDNKFRQELKVCLKKDIITAHAAFGYLAKEYGLNQVAIAGLSPDAEPSPRQLAEVANFARQNNLKYIFFESLVSPKLAQTVAAEIGAQSLVLNPIEGLSDEEIAEGKSYFTEMRNNLVNLKIALQCQ